MKPLQELIILMQNCKQTPSQTVLQHGESVKQFFYSNKEDWKLPSWYTKYIDKFILHDEETINLYLLYHDCGKPSVHQLDENGKSHFPNHAEASKQVFLEYFNNQISANLIGWDMIIHTSSSDEIKNWLSIWSIQDTCTLLLASLAELHSNASMFGGTSSISFKTKFTNLERRGKQICKHYFGEA